MALMHWDESMSVGVEELDRQHRQLISLLNESYETIQRHDEHKMSQLIAKMADYAAMHFAFEEELIRRHGFPGVEEHKAMHDKFNADVDDFRKKQFDRTNLSQIFVYLSRWLARHIMNEDMEYVACLPARGKETH